MNVVEGMTAHSLKNNGFLSLYNGLSAAVMRQGTYSTCRFAFYEASKEYLLARANATSSTPITQLPFYQKMFVAGMAGGIGSIFGSPFDLINVRMQNDFKLAPEKRRNYKHAIEALFRIHRTEGFFALYAGFQMATLRGILVTVGQFRFIFNYLIIFYCRLNRLGQLAFYDEFKSGLLQTKYFKDNLFTHFAASMGAGLIATVITMPADVIKTLVMNAKPEERKGMWHTVLDVLKRDKLGLFRGFWPRYIRLGPFTILTFVFYEKLKHSYFYLLG